MTGLLKKVVVIVLFMLVTALPVQAQIAASPNPARVGQVVTISNTSSDSTHRLLNCRIEGQGSYGDISAGQSVSFTIPQDAQPGSSYTFACDGYTSSSVEFPLPVNPVSIGVAASPPADSDGDGIPDDQDQCPNQPAPNSNNGCPPQQPPPPSNPDVDTDGDTVPDSDDLCPTDPGIPEWNGCPDADGDGLTTQYDNCPNQAGPRENLGCPDQSQPVPTAQSAPAIVLPTLPDDGQCYVATTGTTPVNIREGTATTTAIVGSLAPRLVYSVEGVTLDESDQRWFLLSDGGYVASFVVRSTPACDALIPDSADVQAVSLDVTDAFADCPDLLELAADVPVFVLFEAADSADPCAALEEALNDLFFSAAIALSIDTYEILNIMLDECTLQAMFAISLLGEESESDTSTEQAINDLGCGTPLAYDGLVLLDLATLSGTSDRDRVLNNDLTPAEAAVRAVIEGECGLIWEPFGQEILLYLLSITDSDAELLGMMSNICDYIDLMLNGPGTFAPRYIDVDPRYVNEQRIRNENLTADEIRLRDALEAECGIQWDPYGQYIFLSQLVASGRLIPDLSGLLTLLDTDPDTFCNRMWSLLPGGEQLAQEPQTTPPEVERIARGDLTPDEATLRDQLEAVCGLYWEPYGRAALIQLSSLESVEIVLDGLMTSPENTCRLMYAMLGISGQPLLPARTDEQQATIERIGRGDLTAEERDLRVFMETACRIAWEPAGREILIYLLNQAGYDSTSVSELIGVLPVGVEPDLDLLNVYGSDDDLPLLVSEACDDLLAIVSDYLRLYGSADSPDPYDDNDADYLATRMRDRIESDNLSTSESQLRDALVDTCGFSWELVGRELLIRIAVAGNVDDSLARFAANPDAFCDEMLDRAAEFSPLVRTILIDSLPLFVTGDSTATEERMATSGDYTPSETALRGILEHQCGIAWEAGGFRLMVNIIDNEAIEDALRRFSDAPDDFCEDVSDSEELYTGSLRATAVTQIDTRTATERRLATDARLTLDELRLRGFLEVSCGIPWDPYGLRLLAGYIDSDSVETAIAAHNADPIAFCEARIAEAIAMGMPPPEDRTLERSDAEPRDLSTPLPGATGTPDSDIRPLMPRDDSDDSDPAPTDAEISLLRGLIQDCGIGDALAEELLNAIVAAGSATDAIAIQRVNPDGFCDGMRRLASASPPERDDTDHTTTEPSSDEPPPIPDADAVPTRTERELSPLFDTVFTTPASSSAVFQIEQDGVQRLYLLNASGEFVDVTGDTVGDALLPAFSPDSNQLAFIQVTPDGTRQLALLDFTSPVNPTVRTLSVPGLVSESKPAWLSDSRLLVSAENETNRSDIWLIDTGNETSQPVLWMSDATAPTIDNRERNVAFVRSTDGIPNVFTAALNGGDARPITQDTTGCESPRFGAAPFVLYYQCEQTLYRYGVGGASPLVDGVQAYVPAPVAGFVVYSDDNALYMLDEISGESSPLPSPDGTVNMFDLGQSR